MFFGRGVWSGNDPPKTIDKRAVKYTLTMIPSLLYVGQTKQGRIVSHEKRDMKQTLLTVLSSALISALIAAVVSIYNYNRQIDLSIRLEGTKLFRELAKDFYGDDRFREIKAAVEGCKPLYKSWGGSFSHNQINNYLGFFEDLGFFLKQDLISVDAVDHLFGAYIIEAAENPEMQKYIDNLRRGMQDPEAFKEFEGLAKKLETNPRRERQLQSAVEACKRKK